MPRSSRRRCYEAIEWRRDREVDVNVPSEFSGVDSIRDEIVKALMEAGHISAAQLLNAGAWAVTESGFRIERASIGKKMLSLTVNSTAQEIIRQELRRLGGPSDFVVLPKVGSPEKPETSP